MIITSRGLIAVDLSSYSVPNMYVHEHMTSVVTTVAKWIVQGLSVLTQHFVAYNNTFSIPSFAVHYVRIA